jgi:hypothetical protein
MKMFRRSIMMVAAMGAALHPLAAHAAGHNAAGSAIARSAAPVDAAESLRPVHWILAAIAIGLIVWGGIELLDNDDEAFPVSP